MKQMFCGHTTLKEALTNKFKSFNVEKTCEHCKKMEEHVCEIKFMTFPKQLIFVLDRFSSDREKIDHFVQYYPEIKMQTLCDFYQDCGYPGNTGIDQKTYKLNAVVLHSGGCWGGHYTAYVKDENGIEWNCDDSYVSQRQIDYDDQRAYVISYSLE